MRKIFSFVKSGNYLLKKALWKVNYFVGSFR